MQLNGNAAGSPQRFGSNLQLTQIGVDYDRASIFIKKVQIMKK